jgi:RHS repeat-associated protein
MSTGDVVAVTVPDWADTLLDLVGVNWPNVDEDAYRDMAVALREFADDLADDGQLANNHVQRLLSSGHGEAMDALGAHWGKVKDKHLKDIVSAARTIADALDLAAGAIEAMKWKAVGELGLLAGQTGLALALIPVTGGLSALLGAGAIAFTKKQLLKLITDAMQEAVGHIVAVMTEPAVAALENMAADLVVQVSMDALGVQNGVDLDRTKQAGKDGFTDGVQGAKEGLNLASTRGGGGKGKGFHIEHDEHEQAGTKLNGVSAGIHGKTTGKLAKAKGHQSRNKGRDDIADALDPVIEKAMGALVKSAKTMGDHIGDTLPKAVRQISADHKANDDRTRDRLARQRQGDHDSGANGSGSSGGDRADRGQGRNRIPDSTRDVLRDPRGKGVSLNNRRCKTDPVDVVSGEMILTQTDVTLPGTLPLLLRRTHVSGYHYGRSFGASWASTLDERLEISVDAEGTAAWIREDGSILLYPHLPSGDESVLPVTANRTAALTLRSRDGLGRITYAITEAHTGQTRLFVGNPYHGDRFYWLNCVEDRNGNTIGIQRAADGTPVGVVHSGGYQLSIASDERALVTELALRTPEGPMQLTEFAYDTQNRLTAVSDARGSDGETAALRFTYDAAGRVTSWTDRLGATYRYVYDSHGRVAQTKGPDGFLSSRFSYDPAQRVTRFTDATGAVTTSRFNELGQVVAETDPLGNTVYRQWDAFDNLLSRTDPLGRTATFTWDEHDNLTSITRPDGTRTETAYNELNLPVTITGPDGSLWHQEYDAWGNRTSVIAPDGVTSRFTYDERGALTSHTDPSGATHHMTHDRAGLTLSYTDPLGNTYRLTRDAFGRPLRGVDPLGAENTTEWSTEGWATRAVRPDGSTESWTWDAEGNRTSHTDPTGATTRFEYTHFGKLTARTGADGARYEFRYDKELRLTEVTGPHGLTWTYTYDAAGRLVSETDFDGRTVTYELDAAGRTTARTTPLGERITTAYDLMDRVVEKDSGGEITRYVYDPAGRLVTLTSPTSSLVLDRDITGLLTAETVNGRITQYEYDAAGALISRTTPSGVRSRYAHDAAGRRARVTADTYEMLIARDERGREVARILGDGPAAVTLASAWDRTGRLASRTVTAGQRAVCSRAYGYRSDGHLERVTDGLSGLELMIDLDPVGRPLRVTAEGWNETYAYDAAGNQAHADWPDRALKDEARGERTHAGNRLLRAGRVRYEYDAAGRLVLRQKTRLSRKPDTWHYTWNAEDRLVACRTPDGITWRYEYDPLGRRTAKHRIGPDGTSIEQSVHFTWDGTRLAEQTDTATGITTTWEYDTHDHRPLSQLERRARSDAQDDYDTRFFAIVTDVVGAPTELIDGEGHIAWQSRRTAWGATRWNRSATAYTPLRFPGQYEDFETGLHYNHLRHYDPDAGRYASPDPLGLAPAPNPVAYVTNPFTLTDPLGLIAKGCTEDGGWWGGMLPANLKDDNGQPKYPVKMEINHIPAKASYAHLDEEGFTNDAGMGPAIRMERADHRDMSSTGSWAHSVQWRADQRALIDAGRWDLAMKMDIDEVRAKYGDKYDKHIADMIASLKENRKFQAMLERRGWTIDYDILK